MVTFFWSVHLKGKLHAGESCIDDQLIHYSSFINTIVFIMIYSSYRSMCWKRPSEKKWLYISVSYILDIGPNMRLPRHHGPPMQQFYVPPQHRNFRPPPAYYNGPNKQNPGNYQGPNHPNQQGQWRPQSGGHNSKHGDRTANPEDRKSDLDPHSNPFVPLQVCNITNYCTWIYYRGNISCTCWKEGVTTRLVLIMNGNGSYEGKGL